MDGVSDWWQLPLAPLPRPSQQYLNQFENCCGLREGAILTLLSDIGKPQPRTSACPAARRALRGWRAVTGLRSLRRWGWRGDRRWRGTCETVSRAQSGRALNSDFPSFRTKSCAQEGSEFPFPLKAPLPAFRNGQ